MKKFSLFVLVVSLLGCQTENATSILGYYKIFNITRFTSDSVSLIPETYSEVHLLYNDESNIADFKYMVSPEKKSKLESFYRPLQQGIEVKEIYLIQRYITTKDEEGVTLSLTDSFFIAEGKHIDRFQDYLNSLIRDDKNRESTGFINLLVDKGTEGDIYFPVIDDKEIFKMSISDNIYTLAGKYNIEMVFLAEYKNIP